MRIILERARLFQNPDRQAKEWRTEASIQPRAARLTGMKAVPCAPAACRTDECGVCSPQRQYLAIATLRSDDGPTSPQSIARGAGHYTDCGAGF